MSSSSSSSSSSSDSISHEFNKPGNVLIADQYNNRVIEADKSGKIVWSYGAGPTGFAEATSVIGVTDAERIGTYTLITAPGTVGGIIPQVPVTLLDNRVILVSKHGKILWQYGQFGLSGTGANLLNHPVQSTFVPRKEKSKCEKKCEKKRRHHRYLNGGTVLITDQGNNRVIAVNEKKKIVWEYPGTNVTPADQLNAPTSAQKLHNGHVLIADGGNNRAIEVNLHHQVVRTFTAGGTVGVVAFASRLPNGNTLLTDSTNNRAVEVNKNDQIVWQYKTNTEFGSNTNPLPTRALRLCRGDTIIADQFNNRVIRINRNAVILDYYGLPLVAGLPNPLGNNGGYNLLTTQLGLYAPHDAKVIGDYTGLTNPY